MSDPEPAAPPPRPPVSLGAPARARRLARMTAQADVLAATATAAASRVIDASFATVPAADEPHSTAAGEVLPRLRMHLTCDVDDAEPSAADGAASRRIDVAVTVRIAPHRAGACVGLPDAGAAW